MKGINKTYSASYQLLNLILLSSHLKNQVSSFKSQLAKFMHTLKQIKNSLYCASTFVGLLKSFLLANCFNYILNIISIEAKILRLISPLGIFLRGKSLGIGIYRKFKIFVFHKAQSLSNEIKKYLMKALPKFFSEVMESIMVGSVSVRDTAKPAESTIEHKAFCKVSFRGGITKIDKKKSFKETLENFKRVIRRNQYLQW